MDDGRSLKIRDREQRLAFILRERNVTGQSEHFEQLHCLRVYFGESDPRAAFLRDVDDAEKDRDPDAVDEFRIAEIYHQRVAAAVELTATLPLDLFPC